jgi:hypothetical protein
MAHQPKSATGTISGTQVFLDNAPVTPHIEGTKSGGRLLQFKVTMEPKFRIGPPPAPFTAVAATVELPKAVNGACTDLIFTIGDMGCSPPSRTFSSEVRLKILAVLPTDRSPKTMDEVCTATELSRDTISRHVRGKWEKGKMKVKPDCADVDGELPSQPKDWNFRREIDALYPEELGYNVLV